MNRYPVYLTRLLIAGLAVPAYAQAAKPNILVVCGDDIGVGT